MSAPKLTLNNFKIVAATVVGTCAAAATFYYAALPAAKAEIADNAKLNSELTDLQQNLNDTQALAGHLTALSPITHLYLKDCDSQGAAERRCIDDKIARQPGKLNLLDFSDKGALCLLVGFMAASLTEITLSKASRLRPMRSLLKAARTAKRLSLHR